MQYEPMSYICLMRYWCIVLLCLLTCSFSGFTQETANKAYPKNYFRNPLGIPMQLSGNFGELRKDHYHMGLDLRTNRKENLPVYAAADGYISRISVQTYGYGRAIYITHPNGYTTVYGHLNNFYDTLQRFLTAKQYAEEQWEQDFTLDRNQFPVKKGQFIAWSGNTGGSQGPHLHFEIRDSESGNNINPLHFGLPVADTYPPALFGLYVADGGFASYKAPYFPIPFTKNKSGYTTKDSVLYLPFKQIRWGITAEDRTNTSSFYFGIYRTELWLDDVLQSGFQFEDFSYNDSRFINAAHDYAFKLQNGTYITHLSKLPANTLQIFYTDAKNSVIALNDTLPHQLKIVLQDIKGNTSFFTTTIQYKDSTNIGLLAVTDSAATSVVPAVAKTITAEGFKLYIPSNSIYDTAQFVITPEPKSEFALSPYYKFRYPYIPLHKKATFSIQPTLSITDSLKQKVVMRITRNKQFRTQKVSWQNNWAFAGFNELGDAELLYDTVAPVISAVGLKNGGSITRDKTLTFSVVDRLSSFVKVRTELDGQWLMFRRKEDYILYDFDEHCTNGNHILTIHATDECGNTSEAIFEFTVNEKAKKVVYKKKKTTKSKKKRK